MKKNALQSGFSLVESLVAITILLIVISGPLAISSSSAKSSSFSSEQVTAFFLAQEGVELVEKARDDLLLDSSQTAPWTKFTLTTGSAAQAPYKNCYTSVNSNGCDLTIGNGTNGPLTVTNCSTLSNCLFYLDKAAGVIRSHFTHTSKPDRTPFTRTIKLQSLSANEVKITSTVTWRTGALKQQQQVVVESSLFNVYGAN